MSRWLAILLVLGLGAVIMAQWHGWPPGPSQSGLDGPAGAEGPAVGSDNQQDLARLAPPEPKDDYASVIDRPLFRPERRPAEPSEDEAEPTVTEDTETSLVGMDLSAVIITPTLVSAWIRDPSEPRLRRLRIGDDLAGWSVQEILPDRVMLERQGELNTLILREFTGETNAVPAPAMPQRPIPRRPARMQQPPIPQQNDIPE